MRHSVAMLWRAKGVDLATIALLLGHEQVSTTAIYEHAATGAQGAERSPGPRRSASGPRRYRPSDSLLAFLDGL